jgi:lipopolysaccharide biosynthesis regulator YciM
MLARCQLQLGLLDEAAATIDRALESFGATERAQLIKASIAVQQEDYASALASLEIVREKDPDDIQLQLMLAQSYAALRRWDEAATAVRKVLAADPHNAQAYLTLARLHLHQRQSGEAVDAALEAVFGVPAPAAPAALWQWLQGLGVPCDPADHGVADAEARVHAALASARGRNFIGAPA